MSLTPPDAKPTVLTDATCLACGCHCDDIVLSVTHNAITESRNACDRGRTWFLQDHGTGGRPMATYQGRPVDREEALDRAAEILSKAQAPLVLGLSNTTIEAQTSAVALADRIGAVIEAVSAADAAPRIAAVQRVGSVGATLGEVRNRADVVVFWGVDPVTTHPRHFERYSVEPAGRFVPNGRAGRTVLVGGPSQTATSAQADHFLLVAPEAEFATLWTLRALVHGTPLDRHAVQTATGIEAGELAGWAERLAKARYGAFFYEPDLARKGSASIEAALLLVRDLNSITRFVALSLGGPGNASGAEAVLSWQTGFADAVDFAPGFPRFRPGDATATARLESGEADAAVIIGDPGEFSTSAADHLGRIPTIVIGPAATRPDRRATVGMASATPGIHVAGSVLRSDGVSLPLRPALPSEWPTDLEWLEALAVRLASSRGEPE